MLLSSISFKKSLSFASLFILASYLNVSVAGAMEEEKEPFTNKRKRSEPDFEAREEGEKKRRKFTFEDQQGEPSAQGIEEKVLQEQAQAVITKTGNHPSKSFVIRLRLNSSPEKKTGEDSGAREQISSSIPQKCPRLPFIPYDQEESVEEKSYDSGGDLDLNVLPPQGVMPMEEEFPMGEERPRASFQGIQKLGTIRDLLKFFKKSIYKRNKSGFLSRKNKQNG